MFGFLKRAKKYTVLIAGAGGGIDRFLEVIIGSPAARAKGSWNTFAMPKIVDALAGLIVLGATLIGPAHAFDFEYMETEKLYNTNIKDAIEKEYYVATQAL